MSPYEAALEQARTGFAEGGIPIGAALARDNEVLATGHNRRLQSQDPTAHAEIYCLRAAGRLCSYVGLTLYTTLTPCHLCSGAVVLFGIEEVTIGDSTTYDGGGSLAVLESEGVFISARSEESARRSPCMKVISAQIRNGSSSPARRQIPQSEQRCVSGKRRGQTSISLSTSSRTQPSPSSTQQW